MVLCDIVHSKDRQRLDGGGVFLWGIGSSVGPSIRELVESTREPTVVFTCMRARPAARDIAPRAVGHWTTAAGLDGEPYEMPAGGPVTSGIHNAQPSKHHWALVCESAVPLDLAPQGWLDDAQLHNLRTGSRVRACAIAGEIHGLDSDTHNANAAQCEAVLEHAGVRPPGGGDAPASDLDQASQGGCVLESSSGPAWTQGALGRFRSGSANHQGVGPPWRSEQPPP